jgi:hypothetical protein
MLGGEAGAKGHDIRLVVDEGLRGHPAFFR